MTYTGNPSSEPAAQQKLELTDSLSIAPLFFFDARYKDLFGADDETRTHTTEVTTPSR